MIKIDLKRYRREVVGGVIVLLLLIGGISVFKYTSFNSGFEIVDLSRKSEIVHRRSGEVKDCL